MLVALDLVCLLFSVFGLLVIGLLGFYFALFGVAFYNVVYAILGVLAGFGDCLVWVLGSGLGVLSGVVWCFGWGGFCCGCDFGFVGFPAVFVFVWVCRGIGL